MKILSIFALLLIALVAYTSAQGCIGGIRNPTCIGAVDAGRQGRFCIPRFMWYYNARARQCERFVFRGCGGNQNRWCSLEECNRRCRR